MQGKVENYFFLAFEIKQIRSKYPVLLVVVWDFCFWAIWIAKPVHQKSLGANFEQLLRAFFSCFGGQLFFQFFWKSHSNCSKILHNKSFKIEKNWTFIEFFWNKTGFLGLPKISKLSVLQKGLLLQDWVFRLGKFLLDPKSHFLSLDKLIYKLVFFLNIYFHN